LPSGTRDLDVVEKSKKDLGHHTRLSGNDLAAKQHWPIRFGVPDSPASWILQKIVPA